jgi:predicted MFS family arabinose efflux permease
MDQKTPAARWLTPATMVRPANTGVAPLAPTTLLIFALACGFSVANVYYAQPLLETMAATFHISPASIGIVVTLTQLGYAAGLVFIVPLGDLVDRRKLVVAQTLLSALALAAVGTARSEAVLLAGMVAVGLLAVVVQVLVAFTASLAAPPQRGKAIGFVTSGVVIGILLARLVSGLLADLGGWRSVYLTSAALMVVMAALLFRTLPRLPARVTPPGYGELLRATPDLFLRQPLLRARAVLALLIFATFSTFWTSLVLPLSAAPLSLSHSQIGLFGLAGLAGALAASYAGRLADRGFAQWTTGTSLALLVFSWLPISCLSSSRVALVAGVILLDLAVQAVHVTNQSMILAGRPEAQSRLVGGYMVFYSIGSALGAITSTTLYAAAGWSGVCLSGAGYGGVAFIFWAVTRHASDDP